MLSLLLVLSLLSLLPLLLARAKAACVLGAVCKKLGSCSESPAGWPSSVAMGVESAVAGAAGTAEVRRFSEV